MLVLGGIVGAKNMKICDWYSIRRFMDNEEKDLDSYPIEYASYFAAHEALIKYSARERF